MDLFVLFQIILISIIIGGPIIALFLSIRARRGREREEWFLKRKAVILKILVPKNNEKTPHAAEYMFASLHGIFRPGEKFQEHLSFEIASKKKFIEFYVNVPTHLKDFVEGQIYAQYPAVEIQEAEDYSYNLAQNYKIAATEFALNKPEVYPFKTFPNFEVDPLAGITSVLSKIEEDEQIWIQILARPVPDEWQKRGISYVNALRSGLPLGGTILGTIAKTLFKFLIDIIAALTGRGQPAAPAAAKPAAPKEKVQLSAPQEAAIKGIEEKITKLGFESLIRVVVIVKNDYEARSKLNAVSGAFKQFNTTNLNGFSVGKIIEDPSFVSLYQKRELKEPGYIFNIEELASIFHLPNVTVETPNIVWAGSKKGEPPANLPIEGSIPREELTVFARTDFRHVVHNFGIKIVDRRQHMYAIGKSGTGKSTMLENMIIDDIRQGRGVAVVDPHGDLVNHILDFIPADRINDVIYFNPADRDFPLGFNVLESVDPDLKNIVASGVVGIFKKIFGESWGPRLEYILRNAILALLDYPNSTMLGIMRILTDKNFRAKVIKEIKDPVIRDFFLNEYEKYDPKFRTEAIAPIQNKVGQFLASSTIRNLVGQVKSTFDIEEAMNSRKILLLDLSIGKIGEDSSSLLGAMMITKIQLAAMRRTHIPENERVDFYLYVDEFQNFATESFAVILSEARKYRLNLILTNQYIAQMLEAVTKAVFGNIGTLISFRVGSSDAVALAKEFAPVFDDNDLVNLDSYHIYAKMSIDGVTRPAFSAVTLAPSQDKNQNREKVIKVSRERYSKPREFVEEKIKEWSESERQEEKPKEIVAREEKAHTKQLGSREYEERRDVKKEKWYLPLKEEKEEIGKEKLKTEEKSEEKKKEEPKTLKAGETINLTQNHNSEL